MMKPLCNMVWTGHLLQHSHHLEHAVFQRWILLYRIIASVAVQTKVQTLYTKQNTKVYDLSTTWMFFLLKKTENGEWQAVLYQMCCISAPWQRALLRRMIEVPRNQGVTAGEIGAAGSGWMRVGREYITLHYKYILGLFKSRSHLCGPCEILGGQLQSISKRTEKLGCPRDKLPLKIYQS